MTKIFRAHPAWKGVSSVLSNFHYPSRPETDRFSFTSGHNNRASRRQPHPRKFGTQSCNENSEETWKSLSQFEKEIQNSLCSGIIPLINTSSKEVTLIVGVSGGCDSVGLFHGLLRVLSAHGDDSNSFKLRCGDSRIHCSLHVAHFDHQLRGSESDGDRIFVEELCERHGVPFHCYYWDKYDSINEKLKFSQDMARHWRRSNMSDLLQQLTSDGNGSGFILTAHHADDSLESMMLKLLRGAHITNIKGMDPVTQDANGNWILRPCLGIHKRDIIDYLSERKLTWREDSSNTSNKYLRNKVRNELIPLLTELMGGDEILAKRAENLSKQSKQVRDDLRTRAIEYLQATNSTGFFALPSSGFGLMHKEALHTWLKDRCRGSQITYEQLERVCDQVTDYPDSREWTFNLGYGWNIVREGSILRVVSDSDESKQRDAVEVEWKVVSKDDVFENSTTAGIELFIANGLWEDIKGIFVSTVREENIPFTPPWRKGRSPTAATEFLRGQKLPLHQRREALIMYILRNDGSKLAAAVEVRTKGGWVLDASVVPDSKAIETKRIFVVLPDTSKSFH